MSKLPVSSGLSLEAGTVVTFRLEQAQSPPKFKGRDKNPTSQWEECVRFTAIFNLPFWGSAELNPHFPGWRWYYRFRFDSSLPEVSIFSLWGHLNFRDLFFSFFLKFIYWAKEGREREEERENKLAGRNRESEKQTSLWAGSQTWGSIPVPAVIMTWAESSRSTDWATQRPRDDFF